MAGKDIAETGDAEPVPLDDSGKSKKKLLFILIPVILLLGGGAAAYFTGMLDKILGKSETHAGGEEKAGEHGEAAKEGEEAKECKEGEHCEAGGEGVAFLKIPDMVVNLNSDTENRYLKLSIQLELANEADMAAVEKVMPRVVDQFQTYLRELRVQDLRGSKGIYRLQMELLNRVNQAAAPIQVKDVLFQEILIQ